MTWLPWVLCGILLVLLVCSCLYAEKLREQHEELWRKFKDERRARFKVEVRLYDREQRIGALRHQLKGMEEIAVGSAKLSQLFSQLLDTAQPPTDHD